MKPLPSGNVRARTLLDPALLQRLQVVAAEEDVTRYSVLVIAAVDAVNSGGPLPAVSEAPARAIAQQVEIAIDPEKWRDLRVTAAKAGRTRQGLLRDIMASVAAGS